jgi:hypothetical protein
MKKLPLVTAALLVVTPAARAHTSENVLFTCKSKRNAIRGVGMRATVIEFPKHKMSGRLF